MAEYLVPASVLMGMESGESPGVVQPPVSLDPVPLTPYGHATVSLFSDDTITVDGQTDSTKESPVALGQSLRRVNSQGGGRTFVGNEADGTIEIPGATLTGPSASGVVFIRPEDVGIGAQQIPTDKTQLTNNKLSYYPMVFFRKGQRVRTVVSQQGAGDLSPVNTGNPNAGAFPFVINEPVFWSEWVISVDGTFMTLIFQHPTGTDYRRGRDIWENVLMPLITNANNNNTQAQGYINLGGTSFVVRSKLTRMGYLNYARLNAVYGGNGIIIPIPVYPPA